MINKNLKEKNQSNIKLTSQLIINNNRYGDFSRSVEKKTVCEQLFFLNLQNFS